MPYLNTHRTSTPDAIVKAGKERQIHPPSNLGGPPSLHSHGEYFLDVYTPPQILETTITYDIHTYWVSMYGMQHIPLSRLVCSNSVCQYGFNDPITH